MSQLQKSCLFQSRRDGISQPNTQCWVHVPRFSSPEGTAHLRWVTISPFQDSNHKYPKTQHCVLGWDILSLRDCEYLFKSCFLGAGKVSAFALGGLCKVLMDECVFVRVSAKALKQHVAENMNPTEFIYVTSRFKSTTVSSGVSRSAAEVIASKSYSFQKWKSFIIEGNCVVGNFAVALAPASPKTFAEKVFGVSTIEGALLLDEKRIAQIEVASRVAEPFISVLADEADIFVGRERPRDANSNWLIRCAAYGTVAVWYYDGIRMSFREMIDSRFGFRGVESGKWEIPFSEFSKEANKNTVACLLSVLALMTIFGAEDYS